MKIFGFELSGKASAAEQHRREREARNQRAMTSVVGEPGQAGANGTSAPIAADEGEDVVRVLRAAQTMLGATGERADCRPDEIARELSRRMGAAAAVHAVPEFCPIFDTEIELFEYAIRLLESSILDSEKAIGYRARPLLADLHLRQGFTEVTQYGTLPVFRAPGASA
ncbi:hypothetical protein [Amycolatopsis kentuckyensis]|uniref:hypothetical protein n=1 Tax=Amycolatopsis kentuckyensis TaxID=218823 RepID=UPI003569B129